MQQVGQLEVGRRAERVVVLQQRQRHHRHREFLAARRVRDLAHILDQTRNVDEIRDRRHLFGFLVNHHRRADAAVRVAATAHLSPFAVRAVSHIGEIGEGAHQRDREPVFVRIGDADLFAHVVSHVRERVTLAQAAVVGDVFVASSERHGLERDEADLLRIVEREADDGADFVVVDCVDQRRHQHNLDARFVQVVNRLEFYVEEVANLPVAVGGVADAVELQVDVTQSGFGGLAAEFFRLGEFDAVGRGLNRVVAHLASVFDGVNEVRGESWLAARELHGHLPAWFDLNCVVQNLFDIIPAQLVNEADLVGVHETRVAHHVAAVRQVNRQHRAAAVLDRRGGVVVNVRVVVRVNVASGIHRFDVLQELGVHRHLIFDVTVNGAILDHPDFVVAFDDCRFDLAGLFLNQFPGVFAIFDDTLARLFDALGAQAIGDAGPAQCRFGLLPGFLQRLVRPFRDERFVRVELVEKLNGVEGGVGGQRQSFFNVLDGSMHSFPQYVFFFS
ncbi:MAG: hypothetical protein JMDDDDMK_03854 [Acidobacteria bacterium]|nr:hypothetical protein [Acidobacteriota bacterium]